MVGGWLSLAGSLCHNRHMKDSTTSPPRRYLEATYLAEIATVNNMSALGNVTLSPVPSICVYFRFGWETWMEGIFITNPYDLRISSCY